MKKNVLMTAVILLGITLIQPFCRIKKESPDCSEDSKEAATYSPTCYCSTIGVNGLNFSVRNGKRWNPAAITT